MVDGSRRVSPTGVTGRLRFTSAHRGTPVPGSSGHPDPQTPGARPGAPQGTPADTAAAGAPNGPTVEGTSPPEPGTGADRPGGSPEKPRSRRRVRDTRVIQSFNWAIEGLVWTLRHQLNMQIHFAIAVIVVVASLVFAVTRVELLLVFAAITFVFIAEMLNTAVEHVVDMITDERHPTAKIVKDVAAGAVFVAALNALAVAYLVFYDHIVSVPYSFLRRLRVSEVDLTVVALVLVGLLVIVLKAAVGRGSALHGGWPSGHAAVAFGGWVAVTFIATRTAYAIPISFIALILAFLTAQSRVQGGIHSTLEVVAGALLGIVVTAAVFFIWSPF